MPNRFFSPLRPARNITGDIRSYTGFDALGSGGRPAPSINPPIPPEIVPFWKDDASVPNNRFGIGKRNYIHNRVTALPIGAAGSLATFRLGFSLFSNNEFSFQYKNLLGAFNSDCIIRTHDFTALFSNNTQATAGGDTLAEAFIFIQDTSWIGAPTSQTGGAIKYIDYLPALQNSGMNSLMGVKFPVPDLRWDDFIDTFTPQGLMSCALNAVATIKSGSAIHAVDLDVHFMYEIIPLND